MGYYTVATLQVFEEENYMTGRARGTTTPRGVVNMFSEKAEAKQAADAAAADAAAALEKSHESQRKALKRKGRRASILTSSQGVTDQLSDQLGVPGTLG